MELTESDQRLLAGIIQEAASGEGTITFNFENSKMFGRVHEVRGGGAGRKTFVKEISIKCDDQTEKNLGDILSDENNYSRIRINSIDAIYEFGGRLVHVSENIFDFSVLGPLVKEDRRQKIRATFNNDVESPALLYDGKDFIIGMVKIFDHSYGSLGIEIRTMVRLDLAKSYELSASLNINGHFIKAEESELKRLVELPSDDEVVFKYSAGLVFKERTSARKEERLSYRVVADGLKICINSCFAPDFEIGISLQDMAMSGFKGKILKKQNGHLLWSGCGVKLSGTNLKGQIVSVNDDCIRVEWFLNGEASEKKWADLVSGSRSQEVDLSVSNPEDLMSTFKRSGAAPKEYLEQLKLLGNNTLKGLGNEEQFKEWFFKWIERDVAGRINGHLAGYRLGDNLWCAGDLFSDPDQSQKISRDFSRKFFTHFVDFLLRKSPVPKVYAAWKASHPMWKGLEEYISANPSSVYSNLNGYTFFVDPAKKLSDSGVFDCSEVRAIEEQNITNIIEKLKKNNVYEFAKAFDFDSDRFGSPGTKQIFADKNFEFKRHYFSCTSGTKELLVICTRFPYGVSPFNNTSIIYVLNLGETAPYLDQNLADEIGCLVSKFGVFPHRVVLLTPPEWGLSDSKLPVRTVIVDPRMWLFS